MIVVRMKTGHSRLGNDTFAKFFGDSTVCQCGTSLMTVERFLQDCQTHQNLRAEPWPADTPAREKIYGPVENLQHTAAYVRATEFLSERTKKKKKKIHKSSCSGREVTALRL